MKTQVTNLVVNNVKLTRAILNQLDRITPNNVEAVAKYGLPLGYVRLTRAIIIVVEYEETLLTGTLKKRELSTDSPGYVKIDGIASLKFKTEEEAKVYVDSYNRLVAGATKHIFI